MQLTFILLTLSMILFGPSELLGIPNELAYFFIGYALNGISQGFLFVPLLPEIIDSVYHKMNYAEGEDLYLDGMISDKAAGLYGSFYSLGLILAPIIGSEVY